MKKYLLSMAVLLAATVSFTSCDDDDDNNNGGEKPTMAHYGIYVVNEGSYYSQINGTLDFLEFDSKTGISTMSDSIFIKQNGRTLGGTPNNAVVYNNTLCIAVTDENRIEFVDTKTKKAGEYITIEKPRELAVDNANAMLYVSSYTGKVTKINLNTHAIVAESPVVGSQLEGIAGSGNDVYVCNSCNPDYTYNKDVVRLNATTLTPEDTIKVADNPTQIIATENALYILSMGNYGDVAATVQCYSNGKLTTIGNATMMAYNQSAKLLYMINAPYGGTTEYKVYNENTAETSTFLTSPNIFSPYAIAVDQVYGDVYITSLPESKDYPGSASYTTNGTLYRYTSAGVQIGAFTCGVCPGTIVCDSRYE